MRDTGGLRRSQRGLREVPVAVCARSVERFEPSAGAKRCPLKLCRFFRSSCFGFQSCLILSHSTLPQGGRVRGADRSCHVQCDVNELWEFGGGRAQYLSAVQRRGFSRRCTCRGAPLTTLHDFLMTGSSIFLSHLLGVLDDS